MKEVKDSVKSVKIEKKSLDGHGGGEEDDVMVDVVDDLGETRVNQSVKEKVVESGNGSVEDEVKVKVKHEAIDANVEKDSNVVGVDAMEVKLNDVLTTGSESVVGDAEVAEGKGAETGVTEVDGVAKIPELGVKVDEAAIVNDVVDVTENLERKDEADKTSKEESLQLVDAKVEDGSKKTIEEETVVKEAEIVERTVEEVVDGDQVMVEKDAREDDVDVVDVEEGLEGKDGTQGGVSVELSLGCSDSQNVLSEVVNEQMHEDDVDVPDAKAAEVEVTTESTKADVDAHNEPDATDSSKPDVVAYSEPPAIDKTSDDQSVLNGGNEITETRIEVPDSTVEASSAGENQSVLPADLEGEDAGMDIDEVLGWKDEISGPDISLLEGELKQLKYFSSPENEGQFNVSDLVWGKVRSHPWWPGQIFDSSDASETALKRHKKDCFLVAYFGDRTFAWNESTVLKPFRSNFSQIEKHSSSEAFSIAVDSALEEVSRRVELGLTCSCVSPDVYKKISCQIVENSGIKEESSRRHGIDNSASVNSFEPDKFVDYARLLAKFPHGETDKMDLTMAKAQLSSYGRYKGHRELAEFQFCGDLLEEVVDHASEDGTKKRKAVDTISDGSEKRPALHGESAAKPSFKIGASIQKVASQLNAPGDQVFVNADQSNQSNMLSQLQSTARDPMIIENYPEDELVQENQNGSVEHHQLVAYEQAKLQQQQQQQQPPPVKQTRRSNKKRFFSSNHEIEAKEQLELIERRRQNLATEVLMKYPEGIYFPSEIHLNKMFRRFGPLMESETEVDRQNCCARVVFKKCSDAEVAHSSAGKFNIFGSIIVNYELNYTPLISYKPMPLPMGQDPQDAC